MTEFLQRLLVRAAAIAAILFGALVTIVLAGFTLIAGLVIGLFLTLASWLGMRPGAARRGGRGATARPQDSRPADDGVIDIEMREIEPPRDEARKDPPAPPSGNA